MNTLENIHVLSLAINLPGPVAASRLVELGARVTKIEPPSGDPLSHACPQWYKKLSHKQHIITLDFKHPKDRNSLDEHLQHTDLLLTASRPKSLKTLGLDWETLHARFPKLCQVAIVGYPPPKDNTPAHDLTCQATAGLLQPPQLPRHLLSDLAGAERAVSSALAVLFLRQKTGQAEYATVALSDAAQIYKECLKSGVTSPKGPLGGALASYNIYPAQEGWVALAALEESFWKTLEKELNLDHPSTEDLKKVFATKPAHIWEQWAEKKDIPLVAIRRIHGDSH